MRVLVRVSRALAVTLLLSAVVAAAARAQGVTTGAITGTVVDQQGLPQPGVDVQIVHRGTGYSTTTRTRSNGVYLMQGLEVGGPYSVVVRRIGFQPFERSGVQVKLSEATRIDIELVAQAVELGAVAVEASPSADFAPTRQGVGTQISDTLVQRIPTFSRDYIDLLKLSPQVVYPASGGASGGGAYNRFNTFTVDGANQTERFNLGSTGGVPGGSAAGKMISLEAVKEFRVSFTPSDVRQGNFTGMLVNAVTKNGTNEFHGGATYTYRSNEEFLGMQMVGDNLRASQFDVDQYGFHIGGPIIRDRLHFFIAPEWQQRVSPGGGAYYLADGSASPAPDAPAVPLDSLNRIASIMQSVYGFDVGTTGPIDTENPLTNLFGRLDFQISPTHRMVLRGSYNKAEQDEFFRDLDTHNASPTVQTQGYRFGTQAFSRVAKNNSLVGQLYSSFAGGSSNELIVGYNTIRDERVVPVRAPEVSVGVNMGGTIRAVTFGTEQFSPNNKLDQDILEIVNNFTLPMGDHTWTFGGRFDHTRIYNNFAQASFGVYKFPTIDSLETGAPNGYQIAYANSQNPADIAAEARVRMYSLYAQDQWRANERLTLTLGLRADIPQMLDKPLQNDTVTAAFEAAGLSGVRTDATPKTRVLWSPRVGVNFDPTGDRSTQIRGSLGIYTGPPPYIMLLNAYQNTGLQLVRQSCTGYTGAAATPVFTMDVTQLPLACEGQPNPLPGQAGTVGINLNDPDFKFPQYFGVSAGFDHQLPYNMVFTFEGMYRKAVNGVLVRDLNIRGPRMVAGQPYTDRDGRVLYADTISATGAVTNNNQRYVTSLRGVGFSEGAILVTNQSEDYNYSLSGQLHRRFSRSLEATVAYTYMKSFDIQSLTSDRAISNWRNARQLSTAHETLLGTTSYFSRPHRFLTYGTWTLPWQLTDLTLYYERTSGVPYTYVATGDLNGDLYNGNDLLYIPRDARNRNEIQIGTGAGAAFVQDTIAANAFNQFIRSQECLERQRGRIMERNSCRSPTQNRFDLSIRQWIPAVRGQRLALQIDFFNFLNFLNDDWGQNKLPTLSPVFPDQRALSQTARNPGPLDQSIPTFTFDNRLYQSDPAKANYGAPLPFEGRTGSVYQIQMTLRYTF
jgi:hypothetical protein